MASSHTPTSWYLGGEDQNGDTVIWKDVGVVQTYVGAIYGRAEAASAARVQNAHDALVAALTEAVAYVDMVSTVEDGMPEGKQVGVLNVANITTGQSVRFDVRAARAAIVRAKGEA